MTEEIDDLSYVKYALSLSSVLPEGIPEDFLPENITSLMHSKKLGTRDYQRAFRR